MASAATASATAAAYLKTGNRAPLTTLIKEMDDVSVLSETLIPTILTRLARSSNTAKVADMLGVLYAITVRKGLPIIKNKIGLYIKLLRKYIDDELVCRNCLGLLYALSSDAAITRDEVASGIIPLVMRVMTLHRASMKVHEGCVRLLNRIALFDRENLIRGGVTDGIIDLFVAIIDDISLYDAMDLYAELLFKLTNEGIKARVADLVRVADNELTSDKSYIFIDRTLNSVGFTVSGLPVSGEISVKTLPLLKRKKRVYMSMGHSSEVIGDEALPIPSGCVYVTFAICGETTDAGFKILEGFGNPTIRKMLHDPVRWVKELTAHFGESLHIHYPEAPTEAGRTYYDCRYTPFAGFFRGRCMAVKSGLYLLGHPATFEVPKQSEAGDKFMLDIDCQSVSKSDMRFLYSGAVYPDKKQLIADLIRPLTYELLDNQAKKVRYTQSWAFAQFPGVHYNFLCRGHKLVRRSSRKAARVAASREAASLLMRRSTTKKTKLR